MEKQYNRQQLWELLWTFRNSIGNDRPSEYEMLNWFDEMCPEDEEELLSPEQMPYLITIEDEVFNSEYEKFVQEQNDKYGAKNSLSPEEEIILNNFRYIEL